MSSHLKMDEPQPNHLLDEMAQGVIGKPLDRPDGPLKVSGRATYAHEWDLENLAYGFLVRAPFAKGRVVSLGKHKVEAISGVLRVIDDERLLKVPAQGTANEAPQQGTSDVFYLGQPIALVVAETYEQACHGARALSIEYAAADTVAVDPEAEDAATDTPESSQLEQGDVDKAMRDSAFSVDQIYRTPGHTSAAMEPHCSIAEWDNDKLLLRGSFQMVNFNRNELADSLGIDPENVRILSPFVGGGFGSKLGISPDAVAAAIAAKELGRPVVVAMTRQQVFESTMRRSESRQRIRLAANHEGVLTGLAHEVLVSNLSGEDFFEPVPQATHFIYGGEHRLISLEVARLNRTCAGSVRAPGEAVGVTALENALDELAEAAGIDPVELRKRNIPQRHPEEDIAYSSRKFSEALELGAKRFGWEQRNAQPGQMRDGEWLVGMGMASATRVNLLGESKARVTLNADGTATVETDMTDIGTGSYAILTQIAAEMLGLPINKVEARLGDSDLPPSAGSGGSWGAASSGSSVFLACKEIRSRLCDRLDCDPGKLILKNGEAILGDRVEPLAEILDGETLQAEGHIEPGGTSEKVQQATYGAIFAEVGVNSVTGETRVRRMLGVFGAGRILNEKTARSQCIGGMVWGLGMALTEHLMIDPRLGHIVNHDLAEYHLPVNLDVPQLEVEFLNERDDWANPMQAKGIGELGICGSGAAVVNAIFNATGVRVRDYPATLEKIFPYLPDR